MFNVYRHPVLKDRVIIHNNQEIWIEADKYQRYNIFSLLEGETFIAQTVLDKSSSRIFATLLRSNVETSKAAIYAAYHNITTEAAEQKLEEFPEELKYLNQRTNNINLHIALLEIHIEETTNGYKLVEGRSVLILE